MPSSMPMTDPGGEMQSIHDEWVAQKPVGATHDSDNCPFCFQTSPTNGLEEGMSMSEDATVQLRAKEDEIARLTTQVADLLVQANESAFDAKIAEATAAGETKVAELQAQLDTQVLETESARKELADLVTYLAETADAETAAAEQEARWAGRLEQIKEHAALLPEAHITASTARWSAMEDDEFAALIEDFKAVAKPPVATAATTTATPPATAMVAAAGRSVGAATSSVQLLSSVMGVRGQIRSV